MKNWNIMHSAVTAQLIALLSALWLASPATAATTYPYQSCFAIASRMHQVPVDLLLAVAATESAWNPDARSSANAHGIMQIQWPGTAKHLGVRRVSELYNPCLNIELGARYLRELLDASDNDVETALAAYNYGPGRIARADKLPDGAKKYAAKVAGHRQRIEAGNTAASEELMVAEGVVFESATRAERFARSMNAQIDNARFSAVRETDGQHRVQMHVAEQGLSTTDIATLEALGWSELGDAS
jgi:soluble lytic murein transglycosylase-like protein